MGMWMWMGEIREGKGGDGGVGWWVETTGMGDRVCRSRSRGGKKVRRYLGA